MRTKKLMAGALAGFLMIGASAPTWANPAESGTTGAAQTPVTPGSGNHSLMGMLAPILTEPAEHQAPKRCKPGELYSQHDIVGDPDSCFLNRLDSRDGHSGAGGFPGIF